MKLYLLQSGAQASFDINPSTMPFANLLVIIIAALVLAAGLLYVIVRYVKKIGPIDLSKEHSSQTSLYAMNRENQELDDQLRMQVRAITMQLKTRLRNIFMEFRTCPVAMIALSSSVPGPLYASAYNNHFTQVLLPENRDKYLESLLMAIEDEYKAVYLAASGNRCDEGETMPEWEQGVQERIRKFIGEWADKVIGETAATCVKKVKVYQKYEPKFANDSYRSGIVKSCIAKNENYVRLLKSPSKW